jgi:hypothetical protein
LRISGWKNTLEFVIKSDDFSNSKDIYLENCQSTKYDDHENKLHITLPPKASTPNATPKSTLPRIDPKDNTLLSAKLESPSNKRQRSASLPKIKGAELPAKVLQLKPNSNC